MTNAPDREFLESVTALMPRPITEAQWTDAVEAYQRAKLLTEAVNDLVKAFAEQSGKSAAQVRKVLKAKATASEQELREELQGTLDLFEEQAA